MSTRSPARPSAVTPSERPQLRVSRASALSHGRVCPRRRARHAIPSCRRHGYPSCPRRRALPLLLSCLLALRPRISVCVRRVFLPQRDLGGWASVCCGMARRSAPQCSR
ncbi:hypothetical protein GY45DRAFT_1142656 [Cubamyces sp. BRFM 1775]|nr:hypothetical protein GY45DRAFT_1142656 [Cubamyces sp. BRFM 1775]